jgi:hypothetical protein
MTSDSQKLPVALVAKRALYLGAVLLGWLAVAALLRYLIRPWGGASYQSATAYATVATIAQIFAALFFIVWLRRIYKMEGGKVATLSLLLVVLALILILVVLSYALP